MHVWFKINPDAKLWFSGKVEPLWNARISTDFYWCHKPRQVLSNLLSNMIFLDGTWLKMEQVKGVKVMSSGLQPYATKSQSQNSTSDTQRTSVTKSHCCSYIRHTEFTLEKESNSGHFTVNDVYCTYLLFNKESFYVDAVLPAGSKTVSIHHKDCFSGQNVTC